MTTSYVNMSITLLVCLALYMYYNSTTKREGFSLSSSSSSNTPQSSCPNMLIKKGSQYYLYNTRKAEVPGVNPIAFQSLEDYSEFIDWQHKMGIRCPVLFLENSYNAAGERVYVTRPSATEPQGGLSSVVAPKTPYRAKQNPQFGTLLVDSSKDDLPYNNNSYPPYDPSGYYIGEQTPLDAVKSADKYMIYSPNAMDPNFNPALADHLVNTGYYKDNEVQIKIN